MTALPRHYLYEPIPDQDHLLAALPDPRDLKGLSLRIQQIGTYSKQHRDRGDDLLEAFDEVAARTHHEKALELEMASISIAKRYADFELMFDENGTPLPTGRSSNYPLVGEEQKLASIYCDRLGRVGGLFRRLDKLKDAQKYYSIGAEIEREGTNFGIVNSYCTVNHLLLYIELGERRATPGDETSEPDLSEEIKWTIQFVRAQVEGVRANDAWAKVDLAGCLSR
jgi:hypothetical protein